MNQNNFIEILYSVLKNIVLLQKKTEKCMKQSTTNNYEIFIKIYFEWIYQKYTEKNSWSNFTQLPMKFGT